MKKQQLATTDLIFSSLRSKAEQMLVRENAAEAIHLNNEVAVLLNELEIYELELEMQNDELKASHHALELERLKFAGLFDSAPVGYLILNEKALIIEINLIGQKMLASTFGELTGQNLASFIHLDDRHQFYAFINKMQKTDARQCCELRFLPKDTGTKFIQMDAAVVVNPTSTEKTFYVTLSDITETKKAQHRLWETTERLNQTLKASHTGTWSIKIDEGLVFLDSFSAQILEIERQEPGELEGRQEFSEYLKRSECDPSPYTLEQIYLLLLASDRKKLMEMCAEIDSINDIDLELHLQSPSGQIKTVLVKGTAFNPLGEARYFTGILTDVSELTRIFEIEEEMRRAQEMLVRRASIQAQENEREKIASALHDSVCQLLYGIGFRLNHLHKNENTTVAFDAINELLNQSIRELRAISVDLNPSVLKDFGFCEGIKDMAQRLNQSGFKVLSSIDSCANLLPAEAQLSVFRIIQELLNNSIKHSGASVAKVVLSTKNNQITVVVSDNGKGFSKDIDEALKNGSGLRGIKNRVALLKGELEILNKEGASFTITFPQDNYMIV